MVIVTILIISFNRMYTVKNSPGTRESVFLVHKSYYLYNSLTRTHEATLHCMTHGRDRSHSIQEYKSG